MLKVNKKITLLATTIIGLVILFGFLFYKKQHTATIEPVTVQKIANNQPLSALAPIYSINELIQFNKEFDKLFQRNALVLDNLFSQINHSMLSSILKEEPKQFVLSINLPGINPKDINLSIQNRALYVTTTKKSQSYFYYRLLLPDIADSEKITAKAKHGILEVIIPKTEKTTPSKNIVIHEE